MANDNLDAIMSRLADVYYPVGSYIITSTNTHPNDLGIKGTWSLKSKTLQRDLNSIIGISGSSSTKLFTVNSTNFTLTSLSIKSDGSIPYINLYGYNKVALSDTDVAIGTLDYTALGSSIGTYYVYTHGYVNSQNTALMVTVKSSNDGGTVSIVDIINRTGATSLAAQTSGYVYIQFPLHLNTDNGLRYKDELCDQFHWLRTA